MCAAAAVDTVGGEVASDAAHRKLRCGVLVHDSQHALLAGVSQTVGCGLAVWSSTSVLRSKAVATLTCNQPTSGLIPKSSWAKYSKDCTDTLSEL